MMSPTPKSLPLSSSIIHHSALVMLFLLLPGCVNYNYILQSGAPVAPLTITSDAEQRINMDPLQYRLRVYENRLIMRIYNPTSEPIELLGNQSAAIDPTGQAHPLRGQLIPPNAFIKLIFPPLRPEIYPSGPTFGVGVGYHAHRHYDYLYDEPRYFAIYDENNALYWDWHDEGAARITLVYQRGPATFRDDFTFQRKKR